MRPLAAAFVALVLLAAAPAVAGAAPTLGIADSDASTFVDSSWAGLGISTGRAVVPYDVALTQPVAGTPAGDARMNFDAWIANASAAGWPARRLQTSLGRTGGAIAAPAAGHARSCHRHPSVRLLAPWNEPNFRNASTNPLATRRWQPYYASCTTARAAPCSRAAGGIPVTPICAATRALGSARPRAWGVHAHTDANQFQAGTDTSAPATRFFLSRLGGRWAHAKIWIDEVGAYFRDENGMVWGDQSQQQTTSFILGLASLSPRRSRLYYYNLSNQCSDPSPGGAGPWAGGAATPSTAPGASISPTSPGGCGRPTA